MRILIEIPALDLLWESCYNDNSTGMIAEVADDGSNPSSLQPPAMAEGGEGFVKLPLLVAGREGESLHALLEYLCGQSQGLLLHKVLVGRGGSTSGRGHNWV